jgi:hypothetical protein
LGLVFSNELGEMVNPATSTRLTASSNRNTSVLYEASVSDFLAHFPGLAPVWDEEWRKTTDGCVDLRIKWSEADDTIESNLEHWEIPELAARYGDESSVTAVQDALQRGRRYQEEG